MTTVSASEKEIANVEEEDVRGPTDFQLAMHELKGRPPAIIALIIIFTVITLAIIPQVFSPHNPILQNLDTHLLPPGTTVKGNYFALGTDHLGRDVLSRIIWGSRISLIVGITAVLFSGLIGITIGIVAGFFGGIVDTICSRALDTLLSIPFILLAISVVAILGPSLEVIVGVIALRTWIVYARVVRGEVLALKENEFVVGARAVGCKTFRILFLYLLPNVVSSCIVIATLYLGRMIIIEASLSFLGLGVPPPTPTWGGILADGRGYIDTSWWITFFPGLVLMLTVLSVNLLGDYVRDVLDPRMKRNVD
ncbi:MAG: ABC transporter permease [Nitrospinota bacterium]|nr:ABC transporter permease [Nitrospinota bacterium]